jgi:hypothetical protein
MGCWQPARTSEALEYMELAIHLYRVEVDVRRSGISDLNA